MSCATTADAEIHQGAAAPYSYAFTVTSGGNPFDLTTVTAGEFMVQRESGERDTWTATLSGATTTSIVLTRIFAAGDVPDVEVLTITPKLTTPAGPFYGESRTLAVRALADLS